MLIAFLSQGTLISELGIAPLNSLLSQKRFRLLFFVATICFKDKTAGIWENI